MKIVGTILGVLIVVGFVFFIVLGQPGSSGVVASLRLPDGSEYMVTQHYNQSLEPYTVAFYMRQSPTQKWGWCYIDHQANRWRNVAMTYDSNTNIITITRRGVWQAALNLKRSTFAIGDGAPKRELAAPQEYREPDFSFPSCLKPLTKFLDMTTARDTIVDALDLESFVLCESEAEAKELVGKLMQSLGLARFVIVSLDFNGPGAHFRVRAYMNKPGDTYTWLKE